MPKTSLAVSHLRQRVESDCLPICAQMVLAYLGRNESYERLINVLGTREFGTPADNILRLDQLGVRVTLEELSLAQIAGHLRNGRPVIAFVNTADLPYWNIDVDHVVVVVGIDGDEQVIDLNDPAVDEAPQHVPLSKFELSLLRFDNRCAVLEIGDRPAQR